MRLVCRILPKPCNSFQTWHHWCKNTKQNFVWKVKAIVWSKGIKVQRTKSHQTPQGTKAHQRKIQQTPIVKGIAPWNKGTRACPRKTIKASMLLRRRISLRDCNHRPLLQSIIIIWCRNTNYRGLHSVPMKFWRKISCRVWIVYATQSTVVSFKSCTNRNYFDASCSLLSVNVNRLKQLEKTWKYHWAIITRTLNMKETSRHMVFWHCESAKKKVFRFYTMDQLMEMESTPAPIPLPFATFASIPSLVCLFWDFRVRLAITSRKS